MIETVHPVSGRVCRLEAMQWTELENYRQLLQDYERDKAEYDKRLQTYRAQAAEGPEGANATQLQADKTALDKEQQELELVYTQLRAIRNDLAHARDAVAQ
jgi:hypothetical protein